MTLDEMIRQFNLPKPNYVKLDVDGAELNVLRGAAKTLCSPELRSVLIEIDDTQTEPAIALLKECGFHLAEKFKRAHKKDTQVWYGVFRKT